MNSDPVINYPDSRKRGPIPRIAVGSWDSPLGPAVFRSYLIQWSMAPSPGNRKELSMSHNPSHDPTPTPTSKPDGSELDAIARDYSSGYNAGHYVGYKRAIDDLTAIFQAATAQNVAIKMAEAENATWDLATFNRNFTADGDPTMSGLRDGFRVGFRRGNYGLYLENPTPEKKQIMDAVDHKFTH